jgi:hypothetical protein
VPFVVLGRPSGPVGLAGEPSFRTIRLHALHGNTCRSGSIAPAAEASADDAAPRTSISDHVRYTIDGVSRRLESLLVVASSISAVGAVIAMAVVRGVPTPSNAYSTLTCDMDGVCIPPEGAIPGIVTGALAPIAFEVGLFGLLAALVLRVAASRWPRLVSAGASADAGPSRDMAVASGVSRRASSSDPHDRYRPPPGDG